MSHSRRIVVVVFLIGMLTVGCAPVTTPSSAVSPVPPTATRAPETTLVPTARVELTAVATRGDRAPTVSAAPSITPGPTATEELETMTFTIVYDNNAYDPALRTAWGFSCWVETDEMTVLFDTGGDGGTLMSNLTGLGLNPREIDAVVLSHAHGDHTGGLGTVIAEGVRPTVYVPASFSQSFKRDVGARTDLVEVSDPVTIAPGIHTTGQVGSSIIEQALAVETNEGLVVVTGCAHPGVVDMVRRAKGVVDGDVALVMGGFHLSGASAGQIERIIDELRSLGVKRVAPCHCTGDGARHAFVEAFGEDAILAGVGWSTEFDTRR